MVDSSCRGVDEAGSGRWRACLRDAARGIGWAATDQTSQTTVYVERTRGGWSYGVLVFGVRNMEDETTRPIGRAQVLAERLLKEETKVR